MSEFGSRLKKLLDGRGMTQKDLAIETDFSESRISKYIHNLIEPQAYSLCKIADAMNISIDELMGRKADSVWEGVADFYTKQYVPNVQRLLKQARAERDAAIADIKQMIHAENDWCAVCKHFLRDEECQEQKKQEGCSGECRHCPVYENRPCFSCVNGAKFEWRGAKEKVEIPIFDGEEIHENCTVQVLTNSITGETSVGWWKND